MSDYGAAGLPGFWNSLTTAAGVDTRLLGLNGAPTGVTLRHNGAGYQRENSQTTVGNDSALLRDYLSAQPRHASLVGGLPAPEARITWVRGGFVVTTRWRSCATSSVVNCQSTGVSSELRGDSQAAISR
jgi:hypothetical protein